MELEVKKWKEYSQEEKKNLLIHWWHYYGKMLYTLAEFEQFISMINEDANFVFEIAIASYIYGITSQPIIQALRENKVEELKKTLPKIEEQNEDFKYAYEKVCEDFLNEIVNTYNHPQPNIPMNIEMIFYDQNDRQTNSQTKSKTKGRYREIKS